MVFIQEPEGVFDAPLAEVWEFVGSGDGHSSAHHHQKVRRLLDDPLHGRYSWEQPFDGVSTRFTMRWSSFWPLGVAYEVLEGPFEGSRFFLVYEPRGDRTAVSVVGEFVSRTLADDAIPAAVRRFFDLEYEQDRAAIQARSGGPARALPPRPPR